MRKVGLKEAVNEFPSEGWSRSRRDSLLRWIDATGSADRKVGSGHPNVYGINHFNPSHAVLMLPVVHGTIEYCDTFHDICHGIKALV